MRFVWHLLALSLIMLAPMVQVVNAQDYEGVNKFVELLPDESITTDPNDYNNIANGSFIKESDLIESEITQEGIYYGPFAKSMLFSFSNNAGDIVTITATYIFSTENIMSGSSKTLIRIPIKFNWQFNTLTVIWKDENDMTALYNINRMIEGGNRQISIGEYGIYIEHNQPIIPNINYTMTITGYLKADMPLQTYLTIEKYQITNKTNIEFKKTDRSGGTIYDYTETLDNIYLSTTFIFMEGMGQNLHYGIKTYTNGSNYDNTQIDKAHSYYRIKDYFNADGNDTNETYISLYIPFRPDKNTLTDWIINITIESEATATPWQTKTKFANGQYSIAKEITNAENFLLFSTNFNLSGNTTVTTITIELQCDQDNITFLAGYSNKYYPLQNGGDLTGRHYTIGCTYDLHFFSVIKFTSGQWAEITPTKLYHIYDFGWSTGRVYPGETVLKVSLANASEFIVSGKLANLKASLDGGGGTDDKGGILEQILRQVKAIPGKIYGFLKWIWAGIKQLGEFIYTQFLAFADWLISIIGHAKELATNILYAMPFVMPAMVVIAIVRMNTEDDKKIGTALKGKYEKARITVAGQKQRKYERRTARAQRKTTKAEKKTARAEKSYKKRFKKYGG